ncbi:MAG TPA: PBP1A family penicillin-binding protein [Longimicrobium sp.]|jgi:penicillin-binding protein 1A|uniref:transglycosylase domain-containing protein n=1 Tax=Longimicrobium sp. TaxID=2029185 RepID=UPI002ED8E079
MPEPGPPRPENVYRTGWFPAFREGLRTLGRRARMPFTEPRRVPAAVADWFSEQMERDALFFAAILSAGGRALRGGFRAGGRGLRHPFHRRWILALFALLGFLPAFGWQRCGFRGCPDVRRLAALQPGGAARVFDARGGVLADLSPTRWTVVDIDDLPRLAPEAFVAVEDQNFYRHGGVHWPRFIAQTLRNLIPGQRGAGASTITMQVARNVFPDRLPASDRTVRRKLLEIRVAREIEAHYGKRDILQAYLNNIYFGEGVYGIESAARVYFGKHASALTLPEAALLAGLPKAPTRYSPRRDMALSVRRRNLILSLMAAQGRIAPDVAREARGATVRLARLQPDNRRATRAPYFVEQVRRALEAELGPALYDGGVRVYTTLDPAIQAAAERQVEAQARAVEAGRFGRFTGPRRAQYDGESETPYLQGGAVVMDAHSGDVLALVGGRSWEESRFDRITQGLRQPGSAFKPFVYAAAIQAGVNPTDRIIDDTVRRALPGGEVWVPRNFDGRYRGSVTVRTGLRQSINTVAVKLAERAGLQQVGDVARRAGISRDIPRLPSIAIGATALQPMELARAYTPFATLGVRVEPRWIVRVENAEGAVLWRVGVRRRRVMDRGVAFVTTSLMRGVVDGGTGSAARAALGPGIPAAGKTGTTNGATDAWFVGVTPDHVGLVWFGFDRPRTITASGSGGTLAAPVWGRIMRVAERGEAPEAWRPPGSVVRRTVALAGDRVVAPGCRARGATYQEYFLRAHVPGGICPRGSRRNDEPWWRRAWESARTAAGEWARDAWDQLRARVRRAAGGDAAARDDAGPPARSREREAEPGPPVAPDETAPDEPGPDEPAPEPRRPERDQPADTIRLEAPADPPPPEPAAPADTIRLGAPSDTLVIPAPE